MAEFPMNLEEAFKVAYQPTSMSLRSKLFKSFFKGSKSVEKDGK